MGQDTVGLFLAFTTVVMIQMFFAIAENQLIWDFVVVSEDILAGLIWTLEEHHRHICTVADVLFEATRLALCSKADRTEDLSR